MRYGVSVVTFGVALFALGCDQQSGADAARTKLGTGDEVGKPVPNAVDVIELTPSEEPLQIIVLREQARALKEGRDLLIYVGAPWCEPCTRFRDAAKRGELDAVFPALRLLELDRNEDETRLQAAGCITPMIPLFSRPNAEGGCDLDRSLTGSVKGAGAGANSPPRRKALLAR